MEIKDTVSELTDDEVGETLQKLRSMKCLLCRGYCIGLADSMNQASQFGIRIMEEKKSGSKESKAHIEWLGGVIDGAMKIGYELGKKAAQQYHACKNNEHIS